MMFYDTCLVGASGGIQAILGQSASVWPNMTDQTVYVTPVSSPFLAIAMGQLGWGFNPDHFFDLLAGAALALITLKQLAIRFAFRLSIAIYILGLLWFFLESFTE